MYVFFLWWKDDYVLNIMQLDCIKICVKGTENRYIRYGFISIIRKSRRFLCPTYCTVSCLFQCKVLLETRVKFTHRLWRCVVKIGLTSVDCTFVLRITFGTTEQQTKTPISCKNCFIKTKIEYSDYLPFFKNVHLARYLHHRQISALSFKFFTISSKYMVSARNL